MKSLIYLLLIFCISCFVNPDGKIIFRDDFTKGLNKWLIEGGQSVKADNGKLYVKANPKKFAKGNNGGVCTVWCRQKISGDIQIDFDRKVYLKAVDQKPLKSGYWGFRTYRTYLWFSNAAVKQL